MAPRTIAPGIALAALLGCWEPNHFNPNDSATTGPKGSESGGPTGGAASSGGTTDPVDGTSGAPTTAASESDGDPTVTTGDRPDDPPPQVNSFSITPNVLYQAGHVVLDASISSDVVAVDLVEVVKGDAMVVAEDLPLDFPQDFLVATAAANGVHVYKLRARDELGQTADSNTDTLTVLLPPGGTALGTIVSDLDEKSHGLAVTPRSDGGAFIVGAFENGEWAAFARGYAKDGTLPVNVMPTDGVAIANAVAPAGGGDNVYVVGNRAVTGGFGMYLARVTSTSDVTVLSKLGKGTVGAAVARVGDRIFVAGHASDPDDKNLTNDIRLWIYDATTPADPPLEIAWKPDDESPFAFADDEATAIAAFGDQLIVVGHSTIEDLKFSRSRLVALRLAQSGAILDELLLAPKGLSVTATAVTVTATGEVVIGGSSAPLVLNPSQTPALFGLTPDLELTTELHDLPGLDKVHGVAALPNHRVVVATDVAGVGGTDIRLRGVAWPSGVQTWEYTYKGSQGGDDHVNAVVAEPAGVVHFTGYTQVGGAPRALVGRVHP